jgi:ATP-dependent helicase HrpA
MREEDLLGDLPEDFDREAFPDTAKLENSALPLRYAYRPGQAEDGVTLRLAPGQAKLLQPGMLDWLVPGHLEEKILLLLRGLAKDVRKQLLPIPEKAVAIARTLKPTHGTLVESLAAHLEKHYGVRTFPTDWAGAEIPEHLRVRVEVVGTDDKPIAAARDVAQVKALLAEQERAAALKPSRDVADAWRRACAQWERIGLETWAFDAAPPDRVVVTETAGLSVYAYPGLRLEPEGVALRLFRTPEEASTDHAAALERFFAHELRYELSWLDRDLKDVARLGPAAVSLTPIDVLKAHVKEHLRRHLCARTVEPLTKANFTKAAAAAKEESKGLLWRLLDQLEPILKLRLELALQKPPPPDLARIVPPDFVRHTPHAQLKHLPRYLRALQVRARKSRENPARDAERAAMIARLDTRVTALAKTKKITSTMRDELRWMLEELRVSIFAQELGTAFPVSEKRVEKRLADLGG